MRKPVKTKEPFEAKRYPSFFRLKSGKGEPFMGDDKTVQFATDVEDNYFDRSEDPGELKVSVLQFRRNEQGGGNAPGPVTEPDKLLDIRRSSPKDGTIRIGLHTTEDLKVGDEVEIQAKLGGPEDLESRFWLKVVEPQAKPEETKKEEVEEEAPGLPDYVLVYKEAAPDSPARSRVSDECDSPSSDRVFPRPCEPHPAHA